MLYCCTTYTMCVLAQRLSHQRYPAGLPPPRPLIDQGHKLTIRCDLCDQIRQHLVCLEFKRFIQKWLSDAAGKERHIA